MGGIAIVASSRGARDDHHSSRPRAIQKKKVGGITPRNRLFTMNTFPVVEAQATNENLGLRRTVLPALKRVSREPLLHFLLLGIVLFGVYSYMLRGRGGVEQSKQILLSLDELRLMETYFESQWHRQPTP